MFQIQKHVDALITYDRCYLVLNGFNVQAIVHRDNELYNQNNSRSITPKT